MTSNRNVSLHSSSDHSFEESDYEHLVAKYSRVPFYRFDDEGYEHCSLNNFNENLLINKL